MIVASPDLGRIEVLQVCSDSEVQAELQEACCGLAGRKYPGYIKVESTSQAREGMVGRPVFPINTISWQKGMGPH